MKLRLENTQKKQRVKNLWKLDLSAQNPEQRWMWIYQLKSIYSAHKRCRMNSWKVQGSRYLHTQRPTQETTQRKMGGISLRARDRELKILQLRSMNLSLRQIGAQLSISRVAAWKRYWS